AAGAMALEDAVRLCRLRGTAMQDAVPPGDGAMAAIMGLDEGEVGALCAEGARELDAIVAPANYNAPGQIVIAGAARAVARASELAVARGGKAIALKVSAPFHCAMMRPAAQRLRPELERAPIGSLAFPVVANFDGEPNRDPDRVRDLLIKQIDGPVQWVRTV